MPLIQQPGAPVLLDDMASFRELLTPEAILLEVNVPSKKRLFEAMGNLFSTRLNQPAAAIGRALEEREKMGSTGVGHGVAIPHARLPEIEKPAAAYVRPRLPLAFEAPDGKPVSDIFVLLVPYGVEQRPLELLSWIARLFSDRAFREQLNQREDAQSVYQLFSDQIAR